MDKDTIENKIKELEEEMQNPLFWEDKENAQIKIKELNDLKNKKEGLGKYDRGNAIINIISGAGGLDAEDFSSMLLSMYIKYIEKKNWKVSLIHENKNDHDGYRNISFEVVGNSSTGRVSSGGSGPYGTLRNESGVHRLVRISPFNAKKLRHTSFSLVEVLPSFNKLEEKDFILPENDLKIEFSRSSGPGGQNVNKRETAVRIVHIPSGISAHSSIERSQERNREIALSILKAKIFKKAEESKISFEESLKSTKDTKIEWGNQIRSYVLHPYKMVKDHRTLVEISSVDKVLDGYLDEFIEAERNI